MADDKRNPRRPDRNRIDINEDYELQDWSKKCGVSKEELAAAVKRTAMQNVRTAARCAVLVE